MVNVLLSINEVALYAIAGLGYNSCTSVASQNLVRPKYKTKKTII